MSEASASSGSAPSGAQGTEGGSQGGGGVEAIQGQGGQQQEISASDVRPGNQEGSAQEQPPWLKAKHKVKVNGRDLEVDYQDLVQNYGLQRAAHERFQEAAKMRQEAERLKQMFAQDPISAAVQAGLIPEERAYEMMMKKVQERLEYEALDPVKRHELELREKEHRLRQREQNFQKQQEEARIGQMAEQYKSEYTKSFPEALQRAGVPANERYIRQMTQLALQATQAGMDWKPDDVARLVREEMMGLRQHAFDEHKSKWESDTLNEEATLEDFVATYGEKALKKLIKGHLSKVQKFKAGQGGQAQQPEAPRSTPREKSPSFVSLEDLRRKLGTGM